MTAHSGFPVHKAVLGFLVAGLLWLAFGFCVAAVAAPSALSTQLQRVYYDHNHLFLMPDCPDGVTDFAGPSGERNIRQHELLEGAQEPSIVGWFKGSGTVDLELGIPQGGFNTASYPVGGGWAWSNFAIIAPNDSGTLTVRIYTSPTVWTDQALDLDESAYPWSWTVNRVPGATDVDFLWDVPIRTQVAAEWLGWLGPNCWPGAGDPFSQMNAHVYLDLTTQ